MLNHTQINLIKLARNLKIFNSTEQSHITHFRCEGCNADFQDNVNFYIFYADELINKEYVFCPDCTEKYLHKRLDRRLELLPTKYHKLVDKYNFSKIVDELKDKSLYLWGETGSGKSVLAVMILIQDWLMNKSARLVHYPEFIYKLTHAENQSDTLPFIDEISFWKELLVLDDFGAEKLTDAVRQISYLLIERRDAYILPTIITSNFSLSEIDANIDRRISSRIAGMCKIIEMTGDKRIKK